MVGTLLHERALSQLARAVPTDQHDERQGRRRSFSGEGMALLEWKEVEF